MNTRHHFIAAPVGGALLLTCLFASAVSSNAGWFVVGYPCSVLLLGLGDDNRYRGRWCMAAGAVLCIITAVAVIVGSR